MALQLAQDKHTRSAGSRLLRAVSTRALLSLSLKPYILMRKQSWQFSAKTAFFPFFWDIDPKISLASPVSDYNFIIHNNRRKEREGC